MKNHEIFLVFFIFYCNVKKGTQISGSFVITDQYVDVAPVDSNNRHVAHATIGMATRTRVLLHVISNIAGSSYVMLRRASV